MFPPIKLDNVLAEWVSKKGKTQFHSAETEKYAHVRANPIVLFVRTTLFSLCLMRSMFCIFTECFGRSPVPCAFCPRALDRY